MFREVIIKLAGATLLMVGILGLVFGFLIGNKSMQATGFISGIMSLVLIYYVWMTQSTRPADEEPIFEMRRTEQKPEK